MIQADQHNAIIATSIQPTVDSVLATIPCSAQKYVGPSLLSLTKIDSYLFSYVKWISLTVKFSSLYINSSLTYN